MADGAHVLVTQMPDRMPQPDRRKMMNVGAGQTGRMRTGKSGSLSRRAAVRQLRIRRGAEIKRTVGQRGKDLDAAAEIIRTLCNGHTGIGSERMSIDGRDEDGPGHLTGDGDAAERAAAQSGP